MYAIVEEESNSNWRWFLYLLRRYVTGGHTGLCIISNRHAATKTFMAREFPESLGYHRYYS